MFSVHSQFDILVKKLNSVPKYLTKQEVEGFFACIENPRDKALFGLIYFYGLRVSEAALLRTESVDFKRKKIFIQRVKNGLSGEKPLFKVVQGLLKKYLRKRPETGEALFTGRQGNLTRQRIQQLFKRYALKAGLDSKYSVHSLRHSIATHLLEAGEGIEFVRDHLGHRNIKNTIIYAQITDNGREEAFKRIEGKVAKVRYGYRRTPAED